MSDDDMPKTPEGRLLRSARVRTIPKLSIRAAAARIGMSPEQWGYAERGYVPRRGSEPPRVFHPPAATLARMARAVGISPERLESEGERPDAAGELLEIARDEAAASPAADSPDDAAAVLFPDDPVAQAIWRQPGPEEVRADQIRQWKEIQARRQGGEPPGSRSAGLPARNETIKTLRPGKPEGCPGRHIYGRVPDSDQATAPLEGRPRTRAQRGDNGAAIQACAGTVLRRPR